MAKGEVVDFGGDGVNSEDNGEGDDCCGEDDGVVVVVEVLSLRLSSEAKLQISLRACNFAFYCRSSRRCRGRKIYF